MLNLKKCCLIVLSAILFVSLLPISSSATAPDITGEGEIVSSSKYNMFYNIDIETMVFSVVDANHDLWLYGGTSTWGVEVQDWYGWETKAQLSFKKTFKNVQAARFGLFDALILTTDGNLWNVSVHKLLPLLGTDGESIRVELSEVGEVLLSGVAAFSMSEQSDNVAAITRDGTLYTWGRNNYWGSLGNGTTEDTRTPCKILDHVKNVSISASIGMAVCDDGSLWGWGDSSCLGNGNKGNLKKDGKQIQTVPVKLMDHISFVSCGNQYAAAVSENGILWMWGLGCLGSEVDQQSDYPIKVMENVIDICVGHNNVAVITTDNELWMWGINEYGILGSTTLGDAQKNETNYQTFPSKVLDDVYAVSIWDSNAIVLKTDGTVWTWGLQLTGNGADAKIQDAVLAPAKRMDNVALPKRRTSIVPKDYTETVPDALKYVPYQYKVSDLDKAIFTLKGGKLPDGLSLSAEGVISGIPTELGVFHFTVEDSIGNRYILTLSVLWQGSVDVEQYNEPGYGFVETATDNGRVKDQSVVSLAELKPQTMHLEGPYSEFRGLYLDGRLLKRDKEYTARPGSVVIDVLEETLEEAGSGTHVLSAEFHTNDGNGVLSTKYTTQKYTITGIPGTDVTVVVKGVTVIWSDAEPYINSDNRTMVPFRVIANALGLTVDWDGATREAIFSDGTKTIYFPLDSKTARTSTGGTVAMDTATVSINGRSYAPVRYLAEFFGYSVGWDGTTRTVDIR